MVAATAGVVVVWVFVFVAIVTTSFFNLTSNVQNGEMARSIFAKNTDAKRFLCFWMIKNTPAKRKSPWDNHKSLRSKICSGGGGGSELSLFCCLSIPPFIILTN